MTREEIITIVDNIFVDEFEVDRSVIAPEAPMRESLGLDSLDYVDLVVVIEAQLGVKLTEADFKSVVTFDDFYTTLDQKING
ncbi:acyl carrier protein [Capnocytophaga haemolytica]|jgi:conserved domain protein|uniref:Acyl carrier protein n=1 Tax=Capnocytophaga haemolytica TaxID=45243 RepID=A0AAX2GWZ9_9FLAO|nr:phosphopantetheine-binding protein [Capnocytophaga haemolytica]AMD84720.1 acyl carrier protein [Capnocytophaga haemolytica]SFN72477.1 acyl carrier protein [Capnocytophaga haemolytica]SNV08088.1 Acyl carrier protein [Capnocytophaga haemolytica]